MSSATRVRRMPSGARSIGFELEAPAEVDVQPDDAGVRVREQRDGRPVGELELETFQAALVIDRDGILEEKAQEAARGEHARVAAAVPVALPGATGYRADADIVQPGPRAALPYVYVFALAPHDLAATGGVLVTMRCAAPEWPAGDAILRSLRLLGRTRRTANGED